ncbi:hypothetical protein HU200_052533 [Digitaria exilis]|uniref:Uncharacterized protein n=1 Tax=Digitaria exilis TaxID=1010633 RepID=A0A835AT89_9POAL|nr:hypothetical protein HU200_052533 [Digitaria exilis]
MSPDLVVFSNGLMVSKNLIRGFGCVPYESAKLVPYHEFRRWIPPPPMTVDERMTAARRRIRDPPLCHYRQKYSPFYRCSLKILVTVHLYYLCIILLPIRFHALLFVHKLIMTKLVGQLANVSGPAFSLAK